MSTWSEMTYDEQRAALGLPDVRAYVAGYRLHSAVRRATTALARFGAAWTGRGSHEPTQADYTLAGPKGARP